MAPYPEAHVDTLVLHAVGSLGHILQIDRPAIVLADDEAVVIFRLGQLPLGLKQESAMLAIELPCSRVRRAVLDRAVQIVYGDVAAGHRRRIRFDAHGRLRAENLHLAHARQNAEPLAHLRVGVVEELPFGDGIAGQPHVDDGLIVGICLREDRRAGEVDRQFPGGLADGRLHVRGRGINTLRKIKLQDEVAVACAAVGRHHLQPGNLHELAFQRRGHVISHRLRRGTRITHADLNHRIIHGR